MAKRNVLHISKLEDLKKWLVKDGWDLLPLSNNPYEVLRASKAGKQNPLIIYSGKSSEHLSFADGDMSVIGAFLRDKKKPQTNADRIRSMTDDELAEFLKEVKEDYQWANPDYPDCDDCGEEIGWQSVIDGHMNFMQAESLEDAKKEMIDILEEHCTDQINYYKELQGYLEELNAAEVN